jgi:hypothetical protein
VGGLLDQGSCPGVAPGYGIAPFQGAEGSQRLRSNPMRCPDSFKKVTAELVPFCRGFVDSKNGYSHGLFPLVLVLEAVRREAWDLIGPSPGAAPCLPPFIG